MIRAGSDLFMGKGSSSLSPFWVEDNRIGRLMVANIVLDSSLSV